MRKQLLIACAVAASLSGGSALASLNIPSDGSDGALVVTNDTVIDLSRAVTANWDLNNGANGGRGIYDANKWAVIFKYSSVLINSNCTVTFSNHPSHAPVVWLVSGDVTINGTVSLDGNNGSLPPGLAEPGPGGFRGGPGWYAIGVIEAAGFGPGGGQTRVTGNVWGAGGSYGAVGQYPIGTTYGNPSLIPLIGGSGGGGSSYNLNSGGGGGGGGAILIASMGSISISGSLHANGGKTYDGSTGSGGGIRLVANNLLGNGLVECRPGVPNSNGYTGGLGRIRIERVSNSSSLQITPDPSVVTLDDGATPLIWLPSTGPTVNIISVGGTTPPADPRAAFGASSPDVTLPQITNTTVLLITTNVESAAQVIVRVSPRANGSFTETTASVDQVLSVSPSVIRWTANVPVNPGYSAMQVKVVRP